MLSDEKQTPFHVGIAQQIGSVLARKGKADMTRRRRTRWTQRIVAILLLHMVVLLLVAGCGQSAHAGDPPLDDGWTWYHDVRFPFQVPQPPNWRVGTFADSPMGDQPCMYFVQFLPPGLSGDPNHSALQQPELIWMTVNLNTSCPEWKQTDDQYFVPETQPIAVSGTQAILYDNDSVQSSLQRATVATFGGHQYIISMQTPTSQAEADLALYKHMLEKFMYTGRQ